MRYSLAHVDCFGTTSLELNILCYDAAMLNRVIDMLENKYTISSVIVERIYCRIMKVKNKDGSKDWKLGALAYDDIVNIFLDDGWEPIEVGSNKSPYTNYRPDNIWFKKSYIA